MEIRSIDTHRFVFAFNYGNGVIPFGRGDGLSIEDAIKFEGITIRLDTCEGSVAWALLSVYPDSIEIRNRRDESR